MNLCDYVSWVLCQQPAAVGPLWIAPRRLRAHATDKGGD